MLSLTRKLWLTTFGACNMIKTRLWLIPLWLLAQCIWIRIDAAQSWLDAISLMTSIEHLWYSGIVIVVIVLYANKYGLEYDKPAVKKRGSNE